MIEYKTGDLLEKIGFVILPQSPVCRPTGGSGRERLARLAEAALAGVQMTDTKATIATILSP